MAKPVILKSDRYYGSIFMSDPKSGRHWLFVRDYELRQTPSGKRRVHVRHSVPEYADEAAMLAAIDSENMKPLPESVDRQTVKYTPPGFQEVA